jgi:hypothetical protein
LKKCVRGVRPLDRRFEGRHDPDAAVRRGYCAAVRSALTDDARPPLVASGLKLYDRLDALSTRLERVEKRGPCPRTFCVSRRCCSEGWLLPLPYGPMSEWASAGCIGPTPF